jgi:hypothetical protein
MDLRDLRCLAKLVGNVAVFGSSGIVRLVEGDVREDSVERNSAVLGCRSLKGPVVCDGNRSVFLKCEIAEH